MASILVYPGAQVEIRRADLSWRAYHPGQPGLLAQEYNHALDRLQVTPRIGPPYPDAPGSYRLLLPGCKHHLYYDYDEGKDEVRLTGIESNHRGGKPRLHRR